MKVNDNDIRLFYNRYYTNLKDITYAETKSTIKTNEVKSNNFNSSVPGKLNPNINNYISNQCNVILSYYISTNKYFLNSNDNLHFLLKLKNSRNFVKKTMVSSSSQNKFINNNIGDLIYKGEQCKNCRNELKNNNHNANNTENKKWNNCFFYQHMANKNMNKSQNYCNYIDNNKNIHHYDEYNNINIYNNSCDLSSVNIKFAKDIIKDINCPPFTPSNYKKNEMNNTLNLKKNIDDSSILEQKEEEINDESNNLNEKKKNNEKPKISEYLVEMFGRKGWICKLCNNFNYETRIKCNRCGILKNPKRIAETKQRFNEAHNSEGDWRCINCRNLNYSFRIICNRCKLPKIKSIFGNFINFPIGPSPCPIFCLNEGKTNHFNT